MSVATYKIGPPNRPDIKPDNGFLKKYRPRKPEPSDYFNYSMWKTALEVAEGVQKVPYAPHNDLTDALSAYRHFLAGSGKSRVFSYERYVIMDPSGKRTLENAIIDAQEGAEFLYREHFKGRSAKFQMTSTAISAGNHANDAFPYPATENWQKAIGAHVFWISADVSVALSDKTYFKMKTIIHAEDRYNFNPENKDIETGIPDEANGLFEVTGLAKQYDNLASLTREVEWIEGDAYSKASQARGGRERQPQDNRRARNRI